MRWRLEFYSERRQILAHCRVEAPTPATALVLGRRSVLDEYPPIRTRRARSLFEQAQRVASPDSDGWVLYRIQRTTRTGDGTGDVSRNGVRDALDEFLRQANGQPFCDGCLAVELHIGRFDVQHALDVDAVSMDRGHGRCSVCGQTLMVTRALTP